MREKIRKERFMTINENDKFNPIPTTQTLQQCQFGTGDTWLNLLQGVLLLTHLATTPARAWPACLPD